MQSSSIYDEVVDLTRYVVITTYEFLMGLNYRYIMRRIFCVVKLPFCLVISATSVFFLGAMVAYAGWYHLVAVFSWNSVGMIPNWFTVCHAGLVDAASCWFFCVVVLIGVFTSIYGVSNLSGDRTFSIFLVLITLFSISVCLLLFADTFILFFLAWEAIGLCSFMLIGYWSGREFSVAAAVKAVSVNRVSDVAWFIGMWCVYCMFGISSFSAAADLHADMCGVFLTSVQLCFVTAACGKSAQIGFTGWLLSAMEGPTPVSALMHAATLVTAGVILLIKINQLLSQTALVIVFVVGACTAVCSGIAALVESDLKQIVALSTSSQMGIAFMFIGICDFGLAFLHITAHAVFKSTLFWCVGAINHRLATQYGSSVRIGAGVFAVSAVSISILSLLGTPFMSGFYSKEFLLSGSVHNTSYLLPVVISQILSVLYNCRLFWLSFVSTPHSVVDGVDTVWSLVFPVCSGALLSLLAGFVVFSEISFFDDFMTTLGIELRTSLLVREPRFLQKFLILPWCILILFFFKSETCCLNSDLGGLSGIWSICVAEIDSAIWDRGDIDRTGPGTFLRGVVRIVRAAIVVGVIAALSFCTMLVVCTYLRYRGGGLVRGLRNESMRTSRRVGWVRGVQYLNTRIPPEPYRIRSKFVWSGFAE